MKLNKENMLVLLPRDPRTLFVFWQVECAELDEGQKSSEKAVSRSAALVLRLYESSSGFRDKFADIAVDLKIGERYVKIPEGHKKWSADIGFLDPDGSFHVLAASQDVNSCGATTTEEGGSGSEKRSLASSELGVSSEMIRKKQQSRRIK